MKLHDVIFTSESVSEGHPDKVADQISDSILDAILKEDPRGRVACETMVSTGFAIIAGEITTNCYVDMPQIVRETIKEIGYDSSDMGFDWQTCSVFSSIDKQSSDIAMGVDEKGDHEQGAGDQGLMFGYACNETQELMPFPIHYAHLLVKKLTQVRKSRKLGFLRPDGKSQISVRYENNKPAEIMNVVISSQHIPDVSQSAIREGIIEEVIKKIVPENLLSKNTKFFVNPTGRFVIGGPMGDCGLTGRKIIVDTYGGMARHGGGCFSGKDPSKVDRSAAYMARYIAKNIVAAGLAERCEIQVAYVIGVAEPVSLMVNCYETEKVAPEKIVKSVREIFPLKPAAIIKELNLLRPIYKATASYGHFGRTEESFSWESTRRVADLKNYFNLK